MVIDFTSISMPMAALLASMIGATATITAALLQLRIAWRKEMLARAEHKPVTRKAKRGPVTAIVVLMIASAIGGFALSQYLVSEGRKRDEVLELELRNRIDQLTVSAQRLENVSLYGKDDLLRQVRMEEAQRLGNNGVVTLIGVNKCTVMAGDAEGEPQSCAEQQANRMQLCAEIPATAEVSGIDLYARPDDEIRSWNESKVLAGSDFGGGRYGEKPVERHISDSLKEVCHGLVYWNSVSGLQARMVVRYIPNQQAAAVENGAAGNIAHSVN